MRMLIARAKGVICASAILTMVSGCVLVEQIGALRSNDNQASVPTVS
jgi:hypothetical protein